MHATQCHVIRKALPRRQNLNRDPKEAREGAMLVSGGKHIIDTRNSMNTGCGLTACLMHFRNFRNTKPVQSLH